MVKIIIHIYTIWNNGKFIKSPVIKVTVKKRVYEVSNLGRVKLNGALIEPHINATKYPEVASFRVHRAVAELFVPNPENKPCVDHINTDILDNRACNLRWVTYKENNNNPLTKEHMSEGSKGITSPFKGKPHTEEAKRKMSEAHKGKPSGHKGKTHSEEAKRKMSEAHKNYYKRKRESKLDSL